MSKKQPKLTRPRHPLGPRQSVTPVTPKVRSTHVWWGGRVVAYPNDYNDVGLLVRLPLGVVVTFYVCRTPWDGPSESIGIEGHTFGGFHHVKLTFTHG